MDYPLVVFAISLVLLAVTVRISDGMRRRAGAPKNDERTDAALLLSATLTLLYFIIGFSFSMAISRYDLRKNCEFAEATAIGTEYTRADLLPPADTAKLQNLLRKYLEQRVLFYTTRSAAVASEINAETVRLQTDLWASIRIALPAVPPPLMGLLASGMNDVINSQRGTQAAWLNRIPIAAWVLMIAIATGCCWVIGYRARKTDWFAFMIVPLSASVSFFLIADLDSPRGGAIRVLPYNLTSLLQSLSGQ